LFFRGKQARTKYTKKKNPRKRKHRKQKDSKTKFKGGEKGQQQQQKTPGLTFLNWSREIVWVLVTEGFLLFFSHHPFLWIMAHESLFVCVAPNLYLFGVSRRESLFCLRLKISTKKTRKKRGNTQESIWKSTKQFFAVQRKRKV